MLPQVCIGSLNEIAAAAGLYLSMDGIPRRIEDSTGRHTSSGKLTQHALDINAASVVNEDRRSPCQHIVRVEDVFFRAGFSQVGREMSVRRRLLSVFVSKSVARIAGERDHPAEVSESFDLLVSRG